MSAKDGPLEPPPPNTIIPEARGLRYRPGPNIVRKEFPILDLHIIDVVEKLVGLTFVAL
jgi:hypothetical protein